MAHILDALKVNGYVVVPMTGPDGKLLRGINTIKDEIIQSICEVIDLPGCIGMLDKQKSNVNPAVFVLGGFGALGLPSTMHSEAARKLRGIVYDEMYPLFEEVYNGRNLEMLYDRFGIRRNGTSLTAEAWHRDDGYKCPGDIIFGGWLNLDKEPQYFTCAAGDFLQPLAVDDTTKGVGFIPFEKSESDAYRYANPKHEPITIPSYNLIIFNQTIAHAITQKTMTQTSYRQYFGWRITSKNGPYFSKQAIIENQGMPLLPSGQECPMYASLHWVNCFDDIVQFSKTIKDVFKEDKKRKTKNGVTTKYHGLVKRFMPALTDVGMAFTPYSNRDIEILHPRKLIEDGCYNEIYDNDPFKWPEPYVKDVQVFLKEQKDQKDKAARARAKLKKDAKPGGKKQKVDKAPMALNAPAKKQRGKQNNAILAPKPHGSTEKRPEKAPMGGSPANKKPGLVNEDSIFGSPQNTPENIKQRKNQLEILASIFGSQDNIPKIDIEQIPKNQEILTYLAKKKMTADEKRSVYIANTRQNILEINVKQIRKIRKILAYLAHQPNMTADDKRAYYDRKTRSDQIDEQRGGSPPREHYLDDLMDANGVFYEPDIYNLENDYFDEPMVPDTDTEDDSDATMQQNPNLNKDDSGRELMEEGDNLNLDKDVLEDDDDSESVDIPSNKQEGPSGKRVTTDYLGIMDGKMDDDDDALKQSDDSGESGSDDGSGSGSNSEDNTEDESDKVEARLKKQAAGEKRKRT